MTDFARSLEDLEGEHWGEADYDSYVVTTVHALRRKPLGSLTNEELRLAISQEVGIPLVLDLAFARLRNDPVIGGDFYKGDILALLVRKSSILFVDRPNLEAQLPDLLQRALRLTEHDDYFGPMFRDAIGNKQAAQR